MAPRSALPLRQRLVVMLAVFATVIAGTAATAAVSCAGKGTNCPSGYVKLETITPGCFTCYMPANLACGNRIVTPITCGGLTKKICPAIACAYSSAYAVSGPGACATAAANINTIALSAATCNTTALFKENLVSYCSTGTDRTASLQKYAIATSDAYATALATTLTHYSMAVCNCGNGNSGALAAIGADVQAVGTAFAASLVDALLAVKQECFGGPDGDDVLAVAIGTATAAAKDVQLAVNSVYKSIVNLGGTPGCQTPVVKNLLTKAVAQAIACTFVEVYASAANAETAGVAFACSTSVALAGNTTGVASQTCLFSAGCPCAPSNFGNDNAGFELNDFAAGTPTWSINYNGAEFAPTIVDHADVNDGDVVLTASEGKYFAKIPSGCQTSSISTTFAVPPCASAINIDYVFDCNDTVYNDNGKATITVTDYTTGLNYTTKPVISCSTVGYGQASNGGRWSLLSLPVASGLYTVTVTLAATNAIDCNVNSYLYIDNLSFA